MSQRSAASLARLTCLALAATMTSTQAVAQDRGAAAMAKIPVTTASAEARQEYLKGRTLGENLRAHDSREVLQRAAAKDPGFALAHYSLALNSPPPRSSSLTSRKPWRCPARPPRASG